MSRRQNRRLEHQKLEALKPHAHKFDIDHEADYARLGNSPPERAFHLLACGLELLIVMMNSGFPSFKRGVRRDASKWTRQTLLWKGAQAAGYMARANATLMALMDGRLSDDEDGVDPVTDRQFHLAMRKSVEDFYPKLGRLDASWWAEFDVMRDRKPRPEVERGDEPANEYSLALLRDEDPGDDPELVRLQKRYARDYFIYRATLGGMKVALRAADAARLTPKTIPFLDPGKRRVSKYRARALAAWIEGSRPYREYASMEFMSARAAPAGTHSQ